MKDPGRIVIIGAGPTGLGAAYRLQELGFGDFTLLEATSAPGGLARSYVDPEGFTWDVGGHVQFSHYQTYDRLLDRALGDAWFHHQRESWVWIKDRFVPYPFQNNIHRLDPVDRDRALQGLIATLENRNNSKPENFRDWIVTTFGEGIAEIFLTPYNIKVWGYPLESLDSNWIGDRVAKPDLARIRRNIELGRDDISWGPNRTFRFPARGGTGAIWHGVVRLIAPERICFGARVSRIDLQSRRLQLADGRRLDYDALISTAPLDRFCRLCEGLDPGARRAAACLVHSSCHILGVGLRGEKPPVLKTKCWIYYPEETSPYYRVTVFSNYSPHNVPEGGDTWSLMAEVCDTPYKPVDGRRLRQWTLEAMRRDRLLAPGSEVVSFWHRREEHGYPTPFLGRQEVLARIRGELEARRVYSRGRFGAWLYEVSNQDHSFMQGVEVVDRLLGVGEEVTIERPEYVNRGALLKSAQSAMDQEGRRLSHE